MLTSEAFWNKARLNLETAIQFRDRENNAMFQFWATVSLELLGKACLAHFHPVFVVNPEDFKSVRIACGNIENGEYKTIAAKTLYDRLRVMVDGFDEKAASFCNSIAQKRNDELHSSKLPFDGVDLRSWQQQYWRIIKLLCESQNRSLRDLLGEAESLAAEQIIADAKTAIEVAVKGRIKQSGADFKSGKDASTVSALIKASAELARQRCSETDITETCPACGSVGVLRGSEFDEEYIEHLPHDLGNARMRLFCEAEEFKCTMCSLWLSGKEELTISGFEGEFDTEVHRAYEWEPDYGND